MVTEQIKKGWAARQVAYIVGNWKRGAILLFPIALTAWLLGLIVTRAVGWYLEWTQSMAVEAVYHFGLTGADGWLLYAAESVFHFVFIAGVFVGLFVLAELTGTKYGAQMHLWIERRIEVLPVGGHVYKALKLISKTLGGEEGERLIAAVALKWFMDAAGNVDYTAYYVIGDGVERMRDDSHGPDTIIGLYRGHVPSPTSGNNGTARKANLILTDIELGSFAANTAMLGHGLPAAFQPYVDRHLATLRAMGFRIFGDEPKRKARLHLHVVSGGDHEIEPEEENTRP